MDPELSLNFCAVGTFVKLFPRMPFLLSRVLTSQDIARSFFGGPGVAEPQLVRLQGIGYLSCKPVFPCFPVCLVEMSFMSSRKKLVFATHTHITQTCVHACTCAYLHTHLHCSISCFHQEGSGPGESEQNTAVTKDPVLTHTSNKICFEDFAGEMATFQ